MKARDGKHVFVLPMAALAFTTIFAGRIGWAQSPAIVSIEEHWELQIGEPDSNSSAPQASMVMSPCGHLDGQYFIFTLNHQSVPHYAAGGMQVQLWDRDEILDSNPGEHDGVLWHNGDTVDWVQRLQLVDGTLQFDVVNGTSGSWPTFGGGGDLRLTTPTTLDRLNGYVPAISISESEVGYAGNRVVGLTLKKLVWETDDGQSHELNAPIDIDTDLDP